MYFAAFQLQLYVNVDEYIPGIADGAGVRVVIHDQSEMPLPEENGFNVKPGSKTSIEISKVDPDLFPYFFTEMFREFISTEN